MRRNGRATQQEFPVKPHCLAWPDTDPQAPRPGQQLPFPGSALVASPVVGMEPGFTLGLPPLTSPRPPLPSHETKAGPLGSCPWISVSSSCSCCHSLLGSPPANQMIQLLGTCVKKKGSQAPLRGPGSLRLSPCSAPTQLPNLSLPQGAWGRTSGNKLCEHQQTCPGLAQDRKGRRCPGGREYGSQTCSELGVYLKRRSPELREKEAFREIHRPR